MSFITVHFTADVDLFRQAKTERKIPITSRGGGIVLYDTEQNQRKKNIFREHIEEIIDMIVYELYFEQHMKNNQIDVISDLNNYEWSDKSDATTIELFYKWYQQSDNMVRQKIMLLDTRSNNFIYQIHRTATI